MPAFNFQAQFADAVESGEKRQTIRALRKDGRDPKVGDTLYLFTGMRTKACRRLGEGRCHSVERIVIPRRGRIWFPDRADPFCDEYWLAFDDGFSSQEAMTQWFEKTHGLPFEGQLYRWDALR